MGKVIQLPNRGLHEEPHAQPFKITIKGGRVALEFHAPIIRLELDPDIACKLAEALGRMAGILETAESFKLQE